METLVQKHLPDNLDFVKLKNRKKNFVIFIFFVNPYFFSTKRKEEAAESCLETPIWLLSTTIQSSEPAKDEPLVILTKTGNDTTVQRVGPIRAAEGLQTGEASGVTCIWAGFHR